MPHTPSTLLPRVPHSHEHAGCPSTELDVYLVVDLNGVIGTNPIADSCKGLERLLRSNPNLAHVRSAKRNKTSGERVRTSVSSSGLRLDALVGNGIGLAPPVYVANELFKTAYRNATQLYSDSRDGIAMARDAGFGICVASNDILPMEATLSRLGIAADVGASSADLGAKKPSGEFIEKLEQYTGIPTAKTIWVDDDLENIQAALSAGACGGVLVDRIGRYAATTPKDNICVISDLLGLRHAALAVAPDIAAELYDESNKNVEFDMAMEGI